MKTVACIIARTTSSRLPLKVLRSFDSERRVSMLDIISTSLKKARRVDDIFLCTSSESCDDIMEDVAEKNGIKLYRGAATAVIERMLAVAEQTQADYVIRVTGDNVFTAGDMLDEQIAQCYEQQLDYCRVVNVPLGITAEVIKVTALKDIYAKIDPEVSEYLMLFAFDPACYRCGVLKVEKDYSHFSLTVDTPADLAVGRALLRELGDRADAVSLAGVLRMLDQKPDTFKAIPMDTNIKLPYGKNVDFAAFLADQQRRIDACHVVKEVQL
ncbi:spore coat polysaccharide biosynthesis protein SpsF [Ferrimonas sediminum]|uniref:Spore coat polysaccharide biosynthesis protein SpsF n=1 Tax=Ferrimonas sediminum TaxID=718193 RepID=A0A1G8XNA3_9GAMM|nr:hypothetical protein [Ferrimonas sediminum]SDJ92079.1 spore coat polysaccharide biosynthesis protein SpsF [Ferrimonas sediminum]